jgi:hypothetical protein
MGLSKSRALSGLVGVGLLCSTVACGSEEKSKDPPAVVAQAGRSSDLSGMAGRAAAGGPSTMPTTMSAGGAGGQAGMAGHGSAGQAGMAAAGRAAAGMGGSGGGAAGDPAEEDPFGGLFPTDPGAISCEDLFCLEAADCTSLYPDEAAKCKFTDCVDFTCK